MRALCEHDIVPLARARLSRVFRMEESALRGDMVFGVDLVASFRSDFRRHELDVIGDDIRDVADKQTVRALESGGLVIRTVSDYCALMIHCHRSNADEVSYLFRSEVSGAPR